MRVRAGPVHLAAEHAAVSRRKRISEAGPPPTARYADTHPSTPPLHSGCSHARCHAAPELHAASRMKVMQVSIPRSLHRASFDWFKVQKASTRTSSSRRGCWRSQLL